MRINWGSRGDNPVHPRFPLSPQLHHISLSRRIFQTSAPHQWHHMLLILSVNQSSFSHDRLGTMHKIMPSPFCCALSSRTAQSREGAMNGYSFQGLSSPCGMFSSSTSYSCRCEPNTQSNPLVWKSWIRSVRTPQSLNMARPTKMMKSRQRRWNLWEKLHH